MAETLTEVVLSDYAKRLKRHIECVWEAADNIGIPFVDVVSHDESKWSHAEFQPYARQFCGAKDDPLEFAYAWLHHIHYNPHHWQHWMFSDGYQVQGMDEKGILKMPEKYCYEMVADWMGASRAYTGSFDMTEWLTKNYYTSVTLHTWSRSYVDTILKSLGYKQIIR
jgi:hypothetical protein